MLRKQLVNDLKRAHGSCTYVKTVQCSLRPNLSRAFGFEINLIYRFFHFKLTCHSKQTIFCAVLWRHLIIEQGGIITNFLDVSSLTKITDGYTQGHIVEAVKYILNERRITQVGLMSIYISFTK